MKSTTFISKLLISAMIFMIFVSFTINYTSASVAEQSFLFPFKSSAEIPDSINFYKNMHTAPTYKESDSPMYIYCTETTGSFTVRAVAVDTNGFLVPSNSPSHLYLIRNGTKRYISNTVKQDGYDYGVIVAMGHNGKAKGFWSVDSVVGEDGVLPEDDYLGKEPPPVT